METSRHSKLSVARTWIGVGALCLFTVAMVGSSVLHPHGHGLGKTSQHCGICLTHPTASTAVIASGQVVVANLSQPTALFVAATEVVTPITLLTADSRDPPAVL